MEHTSKKRKASIPEAKSKEQRNQSSIFDLSTKESTKTRRKCCENGNALQRIIPNSISLRVFLDRAFEMNGMKDFNQEYLDSGLDTELKDLMDLTIVSPCTPYAYPKIPFETRIQLQYSELINHAIEMLLTRKRLQNDSATNIITLGYREASPGINGHRIAQLNGIVCYYPNTLVSILKTPKWNRLHEKIGDDLMLHLLLNYFIFIKVQDSEGSYMQIAGRSIRQETAKEQASTKQNHRSATLCINAVMYARHYRANRTFTGTHLLSREVKKQSIISRSAAGRIIREIFSISKSTKRLEPRMIHLIPIMQQLCHQFKKVELDALASQMLPVSKSFKEYLRDSLSLMSARSYIKSTNVSKSIAESLNTQLYIKAFDDGYLTQDEQTKSDRKRSFDAEDICEINKRHKKNPCMGTGATALESLQNLQSHKQEIVFLLSFQTVPRRIYRMISRYLREVLPISLFGTWRNFKVLKKLLRAFLYSRKFDVLRVNNCAAEMELKLIPWLQKTESDAFRPCQANELNKRRSMLHDIIHWIFQSLVFPVLRSKFYITEIEGRANEVFFYERKVWKAISELAMSDLCSGILRHAKHTILRLPSNVADLLQSRSLPSSRLRLLPKLNGIRPLMNLSNAIKTLHTNGKKQFSTNQTMECVHRALMFEVNRKKKILLGSSVSNLDDIYQRLGPVLEAKQKCSYCNGCNKPMYFVSVDIERCFDTIRPLKLFKIVRKLLMEDEYLIRKHWILKKNVRFFSETNSQYIFFKKERPAFSSGELERFDELITRVYEKTNKQNTVFVDGVIYDYLKKSELLALLQEHLFCNIVSMNQDEFIQRQGIPQGSILSTLLCNMYFAHFERRFLWRKMQRREKYLKQIKIKESETCLHEELLRYTDDFLFVTSELSRAKEFCRWMHQGNEEYGCFVNFTKSRVNFDAWTEPSSKDGKRHVIPRFDKEEKGHHHKSLPYVSWCGLLIDPTTLQIYVNYEKLNYRVLQSSIPVDNTKALKTVLVTRVLASIRQKWHAMFFSDSWLLPKTIEINVYQMIFVAALRFYVLLDSLPFVQQDSKFFVDMVDVILKEINYGIERRVKSTLEYPDVASEVELQRRKDSKVSCTIQDIGTQVFVQVFKLQPQRPWSKMIGSLAGKKKKSRIDFLKLSRDQRNVHFRGQLLNE